MTTILTIFISSLGLSLCLTPIVRRFACHYHLVDRPSDRKVHTKPIPRLGGVAIYLAFCLPFLASLFFPTAVVKQIITDSSSLWILAGSTLVFGMGVVDDVRRLRPEIKLAVQVVAALLAYQGGATIYHIALPWNSVLSLGWLSLPATIFWFLLVINGINLIDGLDGLAAGVTLFTSLILIGLSLMGERYLVATGLAALAGASLGFLRYNFNPACIFMGDSGSYFLGYMLAALSILGSMKSEATVAILIPIIALGLPLVDTIIAPIRRFILGRDPFKPDKSHIHHKLLKMGLTHRNAVLLMYCATIVLGIFTLLIVNMRDERAAALLVILAVSTVLGIRKLGYLEYLGFDKVMRYIQDIADEAGFQKHRRTFLDRQIAISEAQSADEMWDKVVDALQLLKFDRAEIQFDGVGFPVPEDRRFSWDNEEEVEESCECQEPSPASPEELEHRILSIELPLADPFKRYGTLHLKKDVVLDPISYYTLRRIEHLRRSIVSKLKMLEDSKPQTAIVLAAEEKMKIE